MTLLSQSESRAKRRPRRWRIVRHIEMLIAIFQARRALARIIRPKRMPLSQIPPYLRRDLGLHDDDPMLPRIYGTDSNLTILAYARLK